MAAEENIVFYNSSSQKHKRIFHVAIVATFFIASFALFFVFLIAVLVTLLKIIIITDTFNVYMYECWCNKMHGD